MTTPLSLERGRAGTDARRGRVVPGGDGQPGVSSDGADGARVPSGFFPIRKGKGPWEGTRATGQCHRPGSPVSPSTPHSAQEHWGAPRCPRWQHGSFPSKPPARSAAPHPPPSQPPGKPWKALRRPGAVGHLQPAP